VEGKEVMLEETRESYWGFFFIFKALLGKSHMELKEGGAVNAGFM
jgi:hypothetical protein